MVWFEITVLDFKDSNIIIGINVNNSGPEFLALIIFYNNR